MNQQRDMAFTAGFVREFHQRVHRSGKKALPRIGPLNAWWELNRDKFRVRVLQVKSGETFDEALARFLGEMPRKPVKFLAMVKELERVRQQKAEVEKRKSKNRQRYLKMMGKRR